MKYREKPVVIEAFQYDGDLEDSDGKYYVPQWAVDALEMSTRMYDFEGELCIETLGGNMMVSVGDYVIQGIQGDLYPCKQDIFEQMYEVVDDDKSTM